MVALFYTVEGIGKRGGILDGLFVKEAVAHSSRQPFDIRRNLKLPQVAMMEAITSNGSEFTRAFTSTD